MKFGIAPHLNRIIHAALAAAALLGACGARGQSYAAADASSSSSSPALPSVLVPGTLRRDTALALAQAGDAIRRGRGGEALTVIYPDIGEPYRKVFSEIIEGIEDQSRARVRGYPVGNGTDLAELHAALKSNKVVIALGRQGLKAASTLEIALGVVVGGVSSAPPADKLSGITLSPDPALLFARLKALLPYVKRVFVVYNPNNTDALIKLAREAARQLGLELVALEAGDLAAAAHRYEGVFAGVDSKRDALWLPQDATTVDEATILPMVLKESWNRNLPIFSSSILHVKKGALFALYPNNVELGRDLASLALGLLGGEPSRAGVVPLRAVRTALNTRTASHIGLNLAPGQQQSFDALFPEP